MTFIEQLKAHIGGLIRIKTELYWYKTDKWDEAAERIYLLLDALDPATFAPNLSLTASALTALDPVRPDLPAPELAAVLLSIDGAPKWVWVYENAIEFIDAQDNPDGSQKIF